MNIEYFEIWSRKSKKGQKSKKCKRKPKIMKNRPKTEYFALNLFAFKMLKNREFLSKIEEKNFAKRKNTIFWKFESKPIVCLFPANIWVRLSVSGLN